MAVLMRACGSRAVGRRAFVAVGILLALARGISAQESAEGQRGEVWELGPVAVGKRYPTTLVARNVGCRGAHDFALEFEGSAKGLFEFADTNVVRGVKKGEQKQVAVFLDARAATPGVYDDGALVTRCLTCPPNCKLDYQRVRIHLTLVGGREGSTTGVAEAGGGQPIGAPPEEPSGEKGEPTARCGGDVTEAFVTLLQRVAERVRALPPAEIQPESWSRFLVRNPPVLAPAELAPETACPLSAACRSSVSLFGACVSKVALEQVLRGFLAQLVRVEDEGSEALGESMREEMTARLLGRRLARTFRLPEGFGESRGRWNDGRGERDEMQSAVDELRKQKGASGLSPVEMLSNRFAACALCTAPLGFAADWSLEPWRLADGSDALPPSATPPEKR